jgi:hypothetical protein
MANIADFVGFFELVGNGVGQAPSLSEGIFLHRWAGGPHKDKPKLKAPVQSMLARGLVEIVDPEGGLPFARFTAAGIEALRAMARNRTFLPADKYKHLIEELQQQFPASRLHMIAHRWIASLQN